jgi:hypothetical protein
LSGISIEFSKPKKRKEIKICSNSYHKEVRGKVVQCLVYAKFENELESLCKKGKEYYLIDIDIWCLVFECYVLRMKPEDFSSLLIVWFPEK